MRKGEKGR